MSKLSDCSRREKLALCNTSEKTSTFLQEKARTIVNAFSNFVKNPDNLTKPPMTDM